MQSHDSSIAKIITAIARIVGVYLVYRFNLAETKTIGYVKENSEEANHSTK